MNIIADKTAVINRLTNEFGYPLQGSEFIYGKIARLQPAIQPAFENWWQTGEIPTLLVEGYDVSRLMAKHSMNPIAAILTLDWLAREPEKAKTSLKKGHDAVARR